jgi:predicted ATPase
MQMKVFEQIWTQLRAKKVQYSEFLEEVHIENIRGIKDISVSFDFPVTVIAGPNASGKSTVLFACACAYDVPGSGIKDYVPSTLFPNLTIQGNNVVSDTEHKTSFEFYYTHKGKRTSMKWGRGKAWSRSFMGQKGGKQPERKLYFRTLANLTSPSEARGFLQLSRGAGVTTTAITADLIAFAQRILPIKYNQVYSIKNKGRELLVASRDNIDQTHYSEFHMSAGERAILRISKDISTLNDALVLIDEIEAGMHPFTQQQLMLELQRIALRNNLQIIVTSHSPVILESVPVEARIFLERTEDNVVMKPAYKDIFQKAFYGQSIEKLSILCEDDIGEAFLYGILDFLNPKIGLIHEDIIVGRDTGKDQFAQHIDTLGKFNQLDSFIFVLDGDAKDLENSLKISAQKYGAIIQPLFLPGVDIPETWAWQIIAKHSKEYANEFGISQDLLENTIRQQDQVYDNATDKPTNISKNKFFSFCEQIRRSNIDVIRIIARKEIIRNEGEIKIFCDQLENEIRRWQSRK